MVVVAVAVQTFAAGAELLGEAVRIAGLVLVVAGLAVAGKAVEADAQVALIAAVV